MRALRAGALLNVIAYDHKWLDPRLMSKRGWVTADEYTALAAEPAYQAMRAAREKEHAARVEQRRRELQPVLDDLATIGVEVNALHELLTIPNPDDRIYPILLDHLKRPHAPWLLEWIGRSFGAKPARPFVWDTLIAMLQSHELNGRALEGVMVAISEIAEPRDLGTLVDLISDQALGTCRIFLVSNLMRSKKPEARTTLLQLQDDPDLTKEITFRLSRTKPRNKP